MIKSESACKRYFVVVDSRTALTDLIRFVNESLEKIRLSKMIHVRIGHRYYGRALGCVAHWGNFVSSVNGVYFIYFHHFSGYYAYKPPSTFAPFFRCQAAVFSEFIPHSAGSVRFQTERDSGERRWVSADLSA